MKDLRSIKKQSGDTIVEVLIALSVLSLAFVISYSTATKGLSQSRSAQEHSEALGVLNSQIELVRTAAAQKKTNIFESSAPFCLTQELKKGTPGVPEDLNVTVSDGLKCIYGFYHYSIVYSGTQMIATVKWNGAGSSGVQREDVRYQVSPVANVNVPYSQNGTPPPPSPPVVAKTYVFKASVGGKDFVPFNCSANEPEIGDGKDGCLINGGSVYAYRAVDILYAVPPALPQGKSKMIVYYRQATINGSNPPVGYSAFNINTRYTNTSVSAGGAISGTGKYSIESDNSSRANQHTYEAEFDNTIANPAINLIWTNNYGLDPNLQIDKIDFYAYE